MKKQYFFGESNQGDVIIRNKAKLDDDRIVEYDQCCLAGTDPKFNPSLQTKYLGRGTIYEVKGIRQWNLPGQRKEYYDFWRVY